MDDALAVLVDESADDEADAALSMTPEEWRRERLRRLLTRPEHLELYILWRQMAGMGGETIGGLWALAQQPGTEALFRDFGILHAREKRLKQQTERTTPTQ